MEDIARGRGRPKGSSSFSNVRISDLASRFPQDAIIPVSSVFLKNMGFAIEAPTLATLPVSQVPAKQEETKISFTIHNDKEEE